MALSAPATPGSSPFDLPWTLTGGRGLFGLDPVRGALLFWGALMVFTLLFVVLSALLTRWQWGRLNRAEAREAAADSARHALTPIERARLRAEAGDLVRQAAATAAAAKRAQSKVEEARAMREAAQQAREAAWQAFDAAQRAYEEALREAAALSAREATDSIEPAVLDDEKADAEDGHELERAALAAFKRGDISVEDLNAVFRQASGWDPVRELQAREVELRRTAESRARRLYQAAAAAERSAVKAADVAMVSAQALAEESVEVAAEARAVREELNAALRVQQLQRNVTKKKIPRQRPRNRQVSRA